MKIKKLHLENFRGVRDATYEFGDKTRIKGRNGIGKSTIASSFFWLMADKDYSLVSNPPVRTIDAIDEVVTTVTADLDYDGKPVQVQKTQKLKRSKTGTVALTNSYMVNSVPKTEKAFKEYLEDLGFNFDKFLPCSHPGVLLAGINNKKERTALRNLLFQMASDITDLDVVKDDPELIDIGLLLQDYKAEEIEAMQNNTLRVIRENYGKEGEILRAKIEGLESAKVEVDVEAHRKAIDELNTIIQNVEEDIYTRTSKLESLQDKSPKVMEINFELDRLEYEAIKDFSQKKNSAEKDAMEIGYKISRMERDINSAVKKASDEEAKISDLQHKIETNQDTVDVYRQMKFNEDTAVCPTCGQKLPKKKIQMLKEEHEKKIAHTVKKGEETIASQKADLKVAESRLKALQADIEGMNKALEELKTKHSVVESSILEMGDTPKPNMTGNEEYQKLVKERDAIQKELKNTEQIKAEVDVLTDKLIMLQGQIKPHEYELSRLKENDRIDSQIAKLREDQSNYEQRKANAEKILHQLKVLNMKKNQMLQDSVNKHFKLIEWTLYLTQKNGETKDACIPTIDGKRFGESMNTGLETMAKIDAMNGIQRFFKLDYPIILDNAEHLDSESIKKLETDHQLILLTVTDDERLVIEND